MDFEKYFTNIQTILLSSINEQVAIINTTQTDFTLPTIPKCIDGYPDTVKNTGNILLYVLPAALDYQFLTTSSKEQNTLLNVFITVKGSKQEELKKMMLLYATALYNAMETNPTFNNTVDLAYITNIQFYEDIEGTSNYKALEATLNVQVEI